MLNSENKTEIISFVSYCNKVHNCQNNQCFFKRRDVFGLSPWATAYIGDSGQEMRDKYDKLVSEYGETTFPQLEAIIGTNCIYVTCKDFKK